MPKLKEDKKRPRSKSDFHYSKNSICCKWYYSKSVLLLGKNVDGLSALSNTMRQTNILATKAPVSCPSIIKLYNNDMGGLDMMDQKAAACRLDRKSKYRFYLRIFFDLIDFELVNRHIVYAKLTNNIPSMNFKTFVEKALISRHSNRKRSFPAQANENLMSQPTCTSSRRNE